MDTCLTVATKPKLYQQRVESHARPEDVSFRHISEPLPAENVLGIVSRVFDVDADAFKRRRHGSALRAVASKYLIRFSGMSQRDVADFLDIGSGSAVCNQLRSLELKLKANGHLRKQVARVEKELANFSQVKRRS